MLAFAYNLIAIFSALDISFLHNVIIAIIVFQTIKHIDTLVYDVCNFVKKHFIIVSAFFIFLTYTLLSRFWYDFKENFYFITINNLQINILLTALYAFFLSMYSSKIDISGITKHKKLLIAPIIIIPIVFLVDYFTHFSLQTFIHIRKVGIDNLHIGIVNYTLICIFVLSVLILTNKKKTSCVVGFISLSFLIALSLITKAGRITPIIFGIYVLVFMSFLSYNFITKYILITNNKIKTITYFTFIALILLSIIPVHLSFLKKNLLPIKNYTSRTIAHRQCIWQTTYTLYKKLPHKLIGHGINSYKAISIMDNKSEQRLNCDKLLSQIDTTYENENIDTNINTRTNNQQQTKNKLNTDKKDNSKQEVLSNQNKIEFSKINSIALHPHSIILQILFEFGQIGLTLFVILLLAFIYEIAILKQSTKQDFIKKSSILSLFVVIYFLFLFSHSIYTFWLWDITMMSFCLFNAIGNKSNNK